MWFLLPIVIFAATAWLWWKSNQKMTGISLNKIPNDVMARLPRPAQLPYDDAVRNVLRLANVFRTQNLASVFSFMSDVYYHTIYNMIQGFNRIGIRKELYFAPYPEQQEESGLDYSYAPTVFASGKAEFQGTTVKGDYAERYVDSTTGEVLYGAERKNAEITVLSVRSPARESGEPLYCEGCGTEVKTSGELFVCRNCGATYRSDSFDWVSARIATPMITSSNASAASESQTKKIQMLVNSAMIAGPAAAILGLFAGHNVFLQVLVVIGCLYPPAAAIYLNRLTYAGMRVMLELQRFDPLANAAIFGFRADYLLRRLFNAHDHNPQDMRTMMDKAGFDAFLQAPHSGSYVLDITGFRGDKNSFTVRDGRQYFDYSTMASLLVLTPQRQIVTVERPLHVVFYRNEATRYSQMLTAEARKCSGCPSRLNLTAHGACKFCGTEYDVADIDWKIAWVDNSAFA